MSPQDTLPGTTAATEYQRVKALLCELAELPVADRETAASTWLQDEPELLARILKMLRSLQREEDFLEHDLPGMIGFEALQFNSEKAEEDSRLPGASIGHFRIVDRLGEGGMAVVYRARQTEPIQRNVALKVISAHATSVQRVRFERECSTLARFAHPNVAVMYESGVSPAGEPYVAMELVEGLPISEWCQLNRAPVQQRIQLFIEACQGLTHAHGKGILHRDIKPSNLLVTEVDGRPTVKVIDFGIAAALTPGIDQLANITGQHLIGTPAYMSPESVHVDDRQALDARSDVFSLGIVLFELLCGKRPYDIYDLPLADWLSALSTRPAPHMRQVFKRLPDSEKQRISENARSGPKRLARALASDLDVIVDKALQLEPERRYTSSNELAADLRRYLRGSAVSAHPPGRIYLTRKFLRRNWAGASVAALLLLMLAGGMIARELGVRQTRLALEESQAISDFLVDLLEHSSPLRNEEKDVSLQDIIDRGADELSDRFADKPLVKARLLHTLGRVYGERGEYLKGSTLLEQSLALLDRAGSDDIDERIRALSDLGVALRRQGRLDETKSVLLQAKQLALAQDPTDPLLISDVSNSLGNLFVIQEDWDKAETEHRYALSLREANLPAGDLQITASRNNLATVLINTWRTEEALPYAEQTLAEWRQSLPPDHPWIGVARNNLAIILERTGRKEESLALNREALQDAEQRLGPDHPDVADLWRNISATLGELGRRDEAKAAMQRYRDILAAALGPEAPRTLAAERRLVTFTTFDQEYATSLAQLDSVRDRLLAGEPNSSLLLRVDTDRAHLLILLGRLAEADEVLQQIRSTNDEVPVRIDRLEALLIGMSGDPLAAVVKLEKAQQFIQQKHSEHELENGEVLLDLARMAIAAGDYQRAIGWSRQAVEFWQNLHRRSSTLRSYGFLGQALVESGQREEGLAQLKLALAGYEAYLPEHHPRIREIEKHLALHQY